MPKKIGIQHSGCFRDPLSRNSEGRFKSLNPCGQILVEKGMYPGKAACTAVLAQDVIDFFFGGCVLNSECVFLHEGEGSCS